MEELQKQNQNKEIANFITQPTQYWKNLPVKTVREIVKSDSVQLSVIKKEIGIIPMQAILTKAVYEELELGFKVREGLNDNDIIDIVTRIINEYWHLKLEDIKRCFYNARGGRYDQNYNKLEIQVVMRWIEQYDQERQEEIMKIRSEQGSEKKYVDMSQVQQKYVDTLNDILKKIQEKPIPRPQRKYNRDQKSQLRYLEAKAKFDDLLQKQNSQDEKIEMNNERITFNQYIIKYA